MAVASTGLITPAMRRRVMKAEGIFPGGSSVSNFHVQGMSPNSEVGIAQRREAQEVAPEGFGREFSIPACRNPFLLCALAAWREIYFVFSG